MAITPAQDLTMSAVGGEERKGAYTTALASLAVLYFVMGFITCLNDTLVPFFRRGFKLTYAQSSLVQFYFFLTYGIMSIPAGRVVERTGYKKGMVWGFSIAAGGALLFFPASAYHQYALFLAALFTIAIGIVLLQVAANPYVTALGPASTASSRLALIQGAGSIGTTVAPLFGAGVILSHLHESHASSEAVKYPYLGIAGLLVLIALLVSALKLPVIQRSSAVKEGEGASRRGVFSFRNLRLGIPAIFAYVGAEVAVGTFLTNYVADTLHIPENEANRYVSFYWGGMLVGRLLGAMVLRMLRSAVVLSCCATAAIVCVGISIFTDGNLAVWSMVAVGLCNSIMFASIFSLAVEGLGSYSMRASGWLSTAIIGGAVMPFLQGVLKDHFSWKPAFLVPVVCYLYIVFYGLNGHKPFFKKH
ncbi:MAG: sugar MFS transporter [Chitinophagaceae bacterium]|nr:sugar MFS transporter [Chitinophagaceae bacterium]